jgi:hypothetical protein
LVLSGPHGLSDSGLAQALRERLVQQDGDDSGSRADGNDGR